MNGSVVHSPTRSILRRGACPHDEDKLRTGRQAEDSTVTSYVHDTRNI